MAPQLCLFDLDDTLLRTADLEPFRGTNHVGQQDQRYTNNLCAALDSNSQRYLYSPKNLEDLRAQFPEMKCGVFTRSPRHYATTLLAYAYPAFNWDVVVAYENVQRTKPHPDGIWIAMTAIGAQNAAQVVLVGNDKTDIMAAYRAGCWAVLDRRSWPAPWMSENYRVLERIPDTIISSSEGLRSFIEHPLCGMPELERRMAANIPLPPGKKVRFDKINHFKPRALGGGGQTPVHVMGRLFCDYAELKPRATWHELSKSVRAMKDATNFPVAWIDSIRCYLSSLPAVTFGHAVLCVIPFKPGRTPRLENLLSQVEQSLQANPLGLGKVTCIPDLLAFNQGVLSHSAAHLNQEQRFANVRDHLFVKRPDQAKEKVIVVVDDVVTTGASLIFAREYLMNSEALEVHCVSMTKAISNQ